MLVVEKRWKMNPRQKCDDGGKLRRGLPGDKSTELKRAVPVVPASEPSPSARASVPPE